MNMVDIVVKLMSAIIYCYIIHDYYRCSYDEPKRTVWMIILGLSMVTLITYIEIHDIQIFTTLVKFICFFVLGAIIKKEKSNGSETLFIIILITFQLGLSFFIHLFFEIAQVLWMNQRLFSIIEYVLILGMQVYSYFKIKKLILKYILLDRKHSKRLAIIPIITCFTFLFLIQVSKLYIEISYQLLCLVVTLALLICNVLVLVIINKQIDEEKQRLVLSLVNQKVELEMKHLKRLQQKYESNRKFMHDVKNHLQVLQNLRESDNSISTKYMEAITDKMKKMELHIECSNKVLEALFNEKISNCEEYGIKITYSLKSLDDFTFINDYDLVTIFSNILDNAIEASSNTDKSNIEFHIARHNDILVISLINKNSSKLKFDEKGFILTSKKDKDRHGIGLKNVENCLHTYGGNLEVRTVNDLFELTIILPVPKEMS